MTGRYTAYCPSCQTCETCGCPDADGFSHYAGCQLAVAAERAENPSRRNPARAGKTRRNIPSRGRKATTVEVYIGPDNSVSAVRKDVEEILRRAGIKSTTVSDQAEGAVILAYTIPATHNPVVVAAALKKFFKNQKDVRVSVSK